MTNRQKIELRLSKLRAELSTLAGKDSLEEDEAKRLGDAQGEYRAAESQLQAAIIAESPEQVDEGPPVPDAETRERLELLGKASIGRFVAAAVNGQPIQGPEAEVRAAFGLTDGIPFELFSEPEKRETEQRADAITPAPGTVGLNIQSIQQAIFAPSLAPRLSINMPSVPSGTYTVPTITTSLTAAAKAKGGAIESTAAAFTFQSATPKRVAARLSLSIHDLAAVGMPDFEAALKENLRLALSAELDDQIINGDGQNDKLTGLFQRLTDPNAAGAVVTFNSFHTKIAEQVDGLWAQTLRDLRLVVNPATYQKFAGTFQAANQGNDAGTIADAAAAKLGGFFTHSRMPDGSSNVSAAILHKSGQALTTAVVPVWNSGMLIDDPYTDSAKGERHFTVNVLLGDLIVVRSDAYGQLSFKTA